VFVFFVGCVCVVCCVSECVCLMCVSSVYLVYVCGVYESVVCVIEYGVWLCVVVLCESVCVWCECVLCVECVCCVFGF